MESAQGVGEARARCVLCRCEETFYLEGKSALKPRRRVCAVFAKHRGHKKKMLGHCRIQISLSEMNNEYTQEYQHLFHDDWIR